MITHRKDFDGIQPWPTKREHLAIGKITGDITRNADEALAEPVIPDDEPVLLLQATDPLSSIVADFYADLLMTEGAEKELVDAVIQLAVRMRAYRDEHSPDQRVPEVGKGWLR